DFDTDPQPVERDHYAERQERVASALDKIVADVTLALDDAGIAIPVFFIIPTSGEALLSFATALDPSEQEWSRACDIIVGIVQKALDLTGLQARPVVCAASRIPMGGACVTAAGDEAAAPNL